LALLGAGRTEGIVVDLGEGVSYSTPVYNEYVLPQCITRLDFGGRELSQHLSKVLAQKKVSTNVEDIIRDIKSKYCFVATSDKSDPQIMYKLPDGQTIQLGEELFKTPEIYFDPSIRGLDEISLPTMVYQSISKLDKEIRNDLARNIILTGGSSMFRGLAERLDEALKSLCPTAKVIALPERKYLAWSGACVVATMLRSSGQNWLYKAEYDEHGPSVGYTKRPF
jgi:actin